MKNVKYIIFGLIIAVSIALCFNDYDKSVDGGILADENAVSSARQEIIDKENSFLASEGDVFWTASGKSWHSTHKCTYLSEAKNVYHGSVDEAKLAGKEKGCSKCCNNDSDTSDSDAPNYTDDPIDAGDVFWALGGSLWHKTSDCSYLKNSKVICHGTVEEAQSEGKERACGKCFKEDAPTEDDNKDDDKDNETPDNPNYTDDPVEEGDVFWALGGSLWHKTSDCSYLKNSKVVCHGTVDEALSEGKERACERCFMEEETEDTDNSTQGGATENGEVYWTEGGSTWHKSQDCSSLSKSKNILCGTVDEAKLAGKERECKKCFKTGKITYEDIENNEIKDSDVFFTKEDKAWHSNINCTELNGAERIYNASESEAKALGKSAACDKCGK